MDQSDILLRIYFHRNSCLKGLCKSPSKYTDKSYTSLTVVKIHVFLSELDGNIKLWVTIINSIINRQIQNENPSPFCKSHVSGVQIPLMVILKTKLLLPKHTEDVS